MTLPHESGTLAPSDAMYLAYDAHVDQYDFDGEPHFEHVRRVAFMVPWVCAAVAWLHDVVEDCEVSLDDLRRQGLPDIEVDALDRLTRRQGETYAEFVERLVDGKGKAVWIACRVKEADLIDNLTRCLRAEERSEKAATLAPRYRRALVRVQGALAGHAAFREERPKP